MLAKLFCTKRKSASAQRCLRCLGATIDIVNPITRTANRSGQGGIFASMFTKGQHRGHGDHWAWRLTGNYCCTAALPAPTRFPSGSRCLPWRCCLLTGRLRCLAIRLGRIDAPEGPLRIILCEQCPGLFEPGCSTVECALRRCHICALRPCRTYITHCLTRLIDARRRLRYTRLSLSGQLCPRL